MRIFDTYVQKLKYKVLTELARQTWVGNDAFSVFNDIANQVVKKGEPTMSCCICSRQKWFYRSTKSHPVADNSAPEL